MVPIKAHAHNGWSRAAKQAPPTFVGKYHMIKPTPRHELYNIPVLDLSKVKVLAIADSEHNLYWPHSRASCPRFGCNIKLL